MKTEFLINNGDYEMTKLKAYLIKNDGNVKLIEMTESVKPDDFGENIISMHTKINEKELRNSTNIVFEYEKQVFEMIDIPSTFKMNKTTLNSKDFLNQSSNFKEYGVLQPDNSKSSQKVIDLRVITFLLCLILLLFLFDVYLRR
ncbi:MAG: hypothetical protein K8S87_03990 [Planctomycetes bacterium]|nr:hypothetical protein [Planctomycetota bacterium]